MNSIQQFLNENKSFSISVLLNAFFRLSILQLNQGLISFEDINDAVRTVIPTSSSPEEITAYSGLIYESIIVPSLNAGGPELCMKEEVIGKENSFLDCVLKKVLHKYGKEGMVDGMCQGIPTLKREIEKILLPKSTKDFLQLPSPSLSGIAPTYSDALPSPVVAGRDSSERDIPSHYDPFFSTNSVNINSTADATSWSNLEPNVGENLTMYQEIIPPNILQPRQVDDSTDSNTPDMNNPINRFLAHIRKSGMEILFPQVVHDKVCFGLSSYLNLYYVLFTFYRFF
jgi:hypothetical protein